MVDGDSYVSLASRVRGACRCGECSVLPSVQRWYENDVLCVSDEQLCDSLNDLGRRVCFVKCNGRVVVCSRFVGGKGLGGQ